MIRSIETVPTKGQAPPPMIAEPPLLVSVQLALRG
jgi:hypothetical protein